MRLVRPSFCTFNLCDLIIYRSDVTETQWLQGFLLLTGEVGTGVKVSSNEKQLKCHMS